MTLQSLCNKSIVVNTLQITHSGGFRQKTWTVKYPALPARIEPMDAKTIELFARDSMVVDHTLYVLGGGGQDVSKLSIDRSEQIIYGSRIFEVVSSRNPDELSRYLIVYCKEKVA